MRRLYFACLFGIAIAVAIAYVRDKIRAPEYLYHLQVDVGSLDDEHEKGDLLFNNVAIDEIVYLLHGDGNVPPPINVTSSPDADRWLIKFVQDSVVNDLGAMNKIHVYGIVLNRRSEKAYIVDQTFCNCFTIGNTSFCSAASIR